MGSQKRFLIAIMFLTAALLFFSHNFFISQAIGQIKANNLNSRELEQKLMTRFTLIFYSEIDRAGGYISYGSWGIIGQVLRDGARKLAVSTPRIEEIKRAEVNVARLAKAAVTHAQRLPSGELRIGEPTWDEIKASICPLWPFC